ncbi:MAG: transporter [Pseudomonadota bacterium]
MRILWPVLCVWLLSSAAHAQAASFTAGADYSTGDYGADEDTDIIFVPVSARLRWENVSVRISVPYLSVDGPGDVIPGDGTPIVTDRCASIQFTRPVLFERFCQTEENTASGDDGQSSGLGDIVVAASYALPADITGDFGITFEGRVKLPTADVDAALGTGKTDFTVVVDAAWYGSTITPFVTLGYRIFGDPTFTDDLGDFTVDLENGFTTSAGLTLPIGDSTALTFAYDYLQKSVDTADNIHELYGAITAPLNDVWGITAYGVAGLTDASADVALGVSLRYRFGG